MKFNISFPKVKFRLRINYRYNWISDELKRNEDELICPSQTAKVTKDKELFLIMKDLKNQFFLN